MTQWTPAYARALSTFSDEAMVDVSQSGKLWYAALSWPPDYRYSSLDFSTCATSRDDAVRLCAGKIRAAHLGKLKYRYGDIECGYVLHWKLQTHWAAKEEAMGGWG